MDCRYRFFNLGQNVSRTVSLNTTLTSRSRPYPDWILHINRILISPQEPTLQMPNGNVQEDASPVSVAKGTPTKTLQQCVGQDVEPLSDIYTPPRLPDIETGTSLEERIVDIHIDETESKVVGKGVHFP